MEFVDNAEKKVERILSKLVGGELSAEELEQVSGGIPVCGDNQINTAPTYRCDDY